MEEPSAAARPAQDELVAFREGDRKLAKEIVARAHPRPVTAQVFAIGADGVRAAPSEPWWKFW